MIIIFRISFIFGTITCVGGATGITLAVYLSKALRERFNRIDPVICAAGLICGVPLIMSAVLLENTAPLATWFLFFIGLTLLSLNWSVVPDMLLYTVLPTRRGTASAIQILISHMFGDAASPYIVGAVRGKCNVRMLTRTYFQLDDHDLSVGRRKDIQSTN